ncbi:hypothetical protein AW736_26245 [Termitidicoccus mucosus]|uniref:Uncharacterized protein n=1 Tax=Termitidicoccus mucosus TaxID=1184151 RepID=A0A178IPT3_9BACT|nr:hypothetical protein AW736_26245 [Opitutaceae bacterium TSB47]
MAQKLSQKLAAPAASQNEPVINEEIQTKINAFRAQNPKFVEYLRQLPRERVENMAILRKIEQAEQKERFRQASSVKLEAWLKERPEIATQIAERVATLPAEKQAGARINMIRSAIERQALQQVQSGPKVAV